MALDNQKNYCNKKVPMLFRAEWMEIFTRSLCKASTSSIFKNGRGFSNTQSEYNGPQMPQNKLDHSLDALFDS